MACNTGMLMCSIGKHSADGNLFQFGLGHDAQSFGFCAELFSPFFSYPQATVWLNVQIRRLFSVIVNIFQVFISLELYLLFALQFISA